MNDEIPDTFWPLFLNKLRVLGEVYNPVTVNRMYPFIVSHLPAKMTEHVLMRAIERGLISVDTREIKNAAGPSTLLRVITPKVSHDDHI